MKNKNNKHLRGLSDILRCGDIVEVKSQEEVLSTLDNQGCLENLPFMPEMLKYCGKKFVVYRRAHKTCDTISEHSKRSRRMRNAVHLLNVRCDGEFHGGCDTTCLIFWKESWLRKVEVKENNPVSISDTQNPGLNSATGDLKCTIEELYNVAAISREFLEENLIYKCQATELLKATSPISWWDIRHFMMDLSSGNVGIIKFIWVLLLRILNYLSNKLFHRWLYPHMSTRFMVEYKTPYEILNFQPGDVVQVKSIEEILTTLKNWRNRGLYYDETGEMYRYCNKKYKVLKRVRKVMDERTGKLIELKNESVILDGVICCGHYSPGRLLCPRSLYPFWREIWLNRVETGKNNAIGNSNATH